MCLRARPIKTFFKNMSCPLLMLPCLHQSALLMGYNQWQSPTVVQLACVRWTSYGGSCSLLWSVLVFSASEHLGSLWDRSEEPELGSMERPITLLCRCPGKTCLEVNFCLWGPSSFWVSPIFMWLCIEKADWTLSRETHFPLSQVSVAFCLTQSEWNFKSQK